MPHLVDHLANSFSFLPGTRTLNLHVLVSVPRKYHNLFPYADERVTPKVYIQDILVLLSEDATIQSTEEETNESSNRARFVSGIEANLFTIPSTSCSLLYISKIDSTGQGQSPSPTQTLVKSFLDYFADPTNRTTDTLWLHLFARSQNQYLFPNSVRHPSKRVLNDAQLCLWWKHLLAAVAQTQRRSSSTTIQCYYLLPGFSELDASQLLRQSTPLSTSVEHASIHWVYGSPYCQGRESFPSGILSSPSIADVIPSFPDDPKSRFLDELLAPSQSFHPPRTPPRKRVKTSHREEDSLAEPIKKRTHPSSIASIEEFWEMMGFRQECVSGAVTGFFVLIFTSKGTKSFSHPHPEPGQVSHNVIDRIVRSMLTTHDFSTDQRSFNSTEILETSVRNLSEGLKDASSEIADSRFKSSEESRDLEIYQNYIHRTIKCINPFLPSKPVLESSVVATGASEAPRPVTILAVKKKKKKS